ncbi:MAG: hypothetical protein ACPGLV_05820 [Bacteroidia bacterium]
MLLVLFVSSGLGAQQLGFGFNNYVGSGISNDLGLNVSYVSPIRNHEIQFELEMRSIDWGNALNLGFGFKAKYKQIKSITIGGLTSGYFGISPFQQKSFATYGIAYLPYLKWQSNSRFYLELSFGFRYNTSPGFRDYGNFNQFELPFRITSGWQLGQNE